MDGQRSEFRPVNPRLYVMNTNTKKCSKCGLFLAVHEFANNGPEKLRTACKECERKRYQHRHKTRYVTKPRPTWFGPPKPDMRRLKQARCPRPVPKKSHAMYPRWNGMLQRCYNPKDKNYPNYGGRGIKVCSEWRNDFWVFASFWGEPPFEFASMDRIDNDGGYSPTNCRWASAKQQTRNQRKTIYVDIDGQRVSAIELAESAGMDRSTLMRRLARDSSIERALYGPHGNVRELVPTTNDFWPPKNTG